MQQVLTLINDAWGQRWAKFQIQTCYSTCRLSPAVAHILTTQVLQPATQYGSALLYSRTPSPDMPTSVPTSMPDKRFKT